MKTLMQNCIKVAVHVIQQPRNVHFPNNYFKTTAMYITVWHR